MNSILSLQKFQQERELLPQIINALVGFFGNDCSAGDRRIYDYIVASGNCHDSIYPGQQRIAHNATLSRQHTNTRLKKLAEHTILEKFSLLAKQYRHRKSCIYYLTSLFNHPEVRIALSKFLPALRWWPYEKALEFSLLQKHLTPSNEVNNYIIYGSRKRKSFGDSMNKEFKNMAARSQQQAKKETGPPPLHPIDRKIKEKERELREMIALREQKAKIEANKQTILTPQALRFLSNNPDLQALGAFILDKEQKTREHTRVDTQTSAFPKKEWLE